MLRRTVFVKRKDSRSLRTRCETRLARARGWQIVYRDCDSGLGQLLMGLDQATSSPRSECGAATAGMFFIYR